ncbi:MAG: hypothetical protein AB8F94_13370 [Saprospiraceae bacterium]
MKKWLFIFLILSWNFFVVGQQKVEFQGQFSAIGSYAPDNQMQGFLGARYIPELSYLIPVDSAQTRFFDFEASANINGNTLFSPFDTSSIDGNISPYRIWARYNAKQFELRIGLQKIDFGSATLLRPIQWFNQIDPRDPLQLTNGVYGVLGRYYFLNNANIWLWALYGNEKTRGFDAVETNKEIPEFGGRIQYPTKRGEVAFSYHHRTANSTNLIFISQLEEIPEHRFGLDGKWDLKVGLWFETALIYKTRDLGFLTHQTLFNLGTDYTFGIGNGVNVVLEHLMIASDDNFLGVENTSNITATLISYPLGFFDNISGVFLYNWTAENFTFNINYHHQFEKISTYVMAYYNPPTQSGIQQNDLVSQFSGPGIRLMVVYNH